MTDYPDDPTADATFERLAANALDDLLGLEPVDATALGDHRFDHLLPDLSAAGREEARSTLAGWLSAVDAVDEQGLSPDNAVDLELLRSALSTRLFEHDQVRGHTWNPLLANPGSAIYLLLARDFAPLGDRLRAVAGRLARGRGGRVRVCEGRAGECGECGHRDQRDEGHDRGRPELSPAQLDHDRT